MIRRCDDRDFELIWAIINEAALAYKGIMPADLWTEPYMSKKELQHELEEGVVFWGYEDAGTLAGVIGLQQVQDVTLIRHAYVLSSHQKRGIGAHLLSHLRELAGGAIRFYGRHGFQLVDSEEKDRLLKKYWTVPEPQRQTSVVLVDPKWRGPRSTDA